MPTAAGARPAVRRPVRELLVLAAVAGADLVFLLGVVRAERQGPPHSTGALLGVPALLLTSTLPLVLYGAVLVVAAGRRDRRRSTRHRLLDATTLALAAAGFLLYVSPPGRAAIASLLET